MHYQYEDLGGGLQLAVTPQHRFGGDAFLLAGFAAAKKADRVLDLGTGCGIIPFVLQRQVAPAAVTGLDIQPAAVAQFHHSIRRSGLQNMQAVEGDIRRADALFGAEQFDLITCNPPYFPAGSGPVAASGAGRIARHQLLCTAADICRASARLLRYGGRLCVCQRPAQLVDVLAEMRAHRLEPKRLQLVVQRPGAAPWLALIEGRKGGRPTLQVLPDFVVEAPDGSFSAAMLALYQKSGPAAPKEEM